MANVLTQDKPQEIPLGEQLVKVRYVGDLRKGPTHYYGIKLEPGKVYDLPYFHAEHAVKEPELFELVDDSPLSTKIKKAIRPKDE